MRRVPLALECVALFDTEPMLLVNHDESEFIEGHRIGKQCVCTNHKPGRATRDRELSPFFLGRRQTADEQGRIQPLGKAPESGRNRPRVLGCEDFRRSNQRSLPTILDCGEHRANSDKRLTGTDLALDEAIHRPGASHVLVDLSTHR